MYSQWYRVEPGLFLATKYHLQYIVFKTEPVPAHFLPIFKLVQSTLLFYSIWIASARSWNTILALIFLKIINPDYLGTYCI